jgi:hypothetical protein
VKKAVMLIPGIVFLGHAYPHCLFWFFNSGMAALRFRLLSTRGYGNGSIDPQVFCFAVSLTRRTRKQQGPNEHR